MNFISRAALVSFEKIHAETKTKTERPSRHGQNKSLV